MQQVLSRQSLDEYAEAHVTPEGMPQTPSHLPPDPPVVEQAAEASQMTAIRKARTTASLIRHASVGYAARGG
jgi:hypothetical protein